MKTSTFILAASAALVAAQDIKPFIPECSHKCLQDAASTASTCKIEPLDGKCVCAAATFEKVSAAAIGCVLGACGQEVSVGQVLPGVQKYCEAALAGGSSGGSSSSAAPAPSTSTSSMVPAPTSTKAPTTSAAPTSTKAPTTSAAPTSASTPIGSITSSKPAGNSTGSPSGTSTGRPSSPAVPAGAASASAGFVGLLAAVGLGLFVL